jgi:sugar lactone lactonase YvrE
MCGVVPAEAATGVTPVVPGLDGPRGLDVGKDGRIVVAEADGSVSVAKKVDGRFTARKVGQVPAGFVTPAVAFGPRGRIYVLTPGGAPGTGAATLYRLKGGTTHVVADIGAYQLTDPDPFNLADPPGESNPFGVTVLPDRSVLVSDAAANDLLRVFPASGRVVTVARLKPRVVAVPDALPDVDPETNEPLPPAGTQLPAEDVATSVTVGADGYYYVGELRGFPATPGTSSVWRIAPGSVNALCDHEHPDTGSCRLYQDGFTSIVDLGAGPDGSIYVVELVQQSWLQWELGLVDPPIGGLFRIRPDHSVEELAAGQLTLPGGVDVSNDGTIYVTGPVFGPGAISRVNG